jgi:sterol desaturase/sphingolipid hydroxylase (fatty acid hydroxylase superfamily)
MKYYYYIVLVYIIVSFYEWFLHRHVMHGDPVFLGKFPGIGSYLAETARHHLEHHQNVNMDMTLGDTKHTTGVYFPWTSTVVFIFILTLTLWKVVPMPILVSIFVVFLHNILWNNWHTRFHDYQRDVPVSDGLPKVSSFPGGFIYDYLWKYHTIHHSQKGDKYNFNIIFPLFDHIFGTLGNESCIDNTKYCKENHNDARCYQEQYHCYTEKDIIR